MAAPGSQYEVEAKYRLADVPASISRLFIGAEPTRQRDRVFLQGRDSFVGFTRGEPVARIRVVNDAPAELTLKRALDDGAALELTVDVSSEETMASLLSNLGLNEVVLVDKTRVSAPRGNATLHLDKVASLGWFLEIELLVDDEAEIDAAHAQIEDLASSLGLSSDQVEKQKYDQLLMASKD